MNSLPSWLSAVGTVGAFAVALFLLRTQMRDRRSESYDRRVAQARLVAAWLDAVTPPPFEGFRCAAIVVVRNASLEPIYDFALRLELGGLRTFVRRPGTLGPEEARKFRVELPQEPHMIVHPQVAFRDSAGRMWLRGIEGQMSSPTLEEFLAFQIEAPGNYLTREAHPTLRLGDSSAEQRGTTVPLRQP